MTREGWMTRFVRQVRPLFAEAGFPLPPIEIRVGQCFGRPGSSGIVELSDCHMIFISPLQENVDTYLVPLLIRCAIGINWGIVDLDRAYQALDMTIACLNDNFNNILAELGPYPEQ